MTATVVRSCTVTPGHPSVHVSCATGSDLRPMVRGDRRGEPVVLQRERDYFVTIAPDAPVIDEPNTGPTVGDGLPSTLLFTTSF
jgi:hypothetical protein